MKHEHQNTLKESDEEEVAKVVQIELAAPGSRPLPATLVRPGTQIDWIFNAPAEAGFFTVLIEQLQGEVVLPIRYQGKFLNGHREASRGLVVGRPGMSCKSLYGGSATTVPPNVIIVDNS